MSACKPARSCRPGASQVTQAQVQSFPVLNHLEAFTGVWGQLRAAAAATILRASRASGPPLRALPGQRHRRLGGSHTSNDRRRHPRPQAKTSGDNTPAGSPVAKAESLPVHPHGRWGRPGLRGGTRDTLRGRLLAWMDLSILEFDSRTGAADPQERRSFWETQRARLRGDHASSEGEISRAQVGINGRLTAADHFLTPTGREHHHLLAGFRPKRQAWLESDLKRKRRRTAR